ncbi:MAG: helix-turn-helix transcriptional regulator [Micavibrio sp.]
MDLIEFIHASNRCSTTKELTEKFLSFLTNFGVDRFIMSEISHDSTTEKEKNHGIIANYPQEWMDHYVANHYVEHDPVYQAALTARKPFTWQQVLTSPDLTKNAKRVMNEARESKLYDGVALTIHQPLGAMMGMGFSGSEKGVRTDKDALSMINAAANQFFIAYSDLAEFAPALNADKVGLSGREREVLIWIARGRTKSDIASILAISESAVKRYCETGFRKLGVQNATLAVAKALRMGIIKPF